MTPSNSATAAFGAAQMVEVGAGVLAEDGDVQRLVGLVGLDTGHRHDDAVGLERGDHQVEPLLAGQLQTGAGNAGE